MITYFEDSKHLECLMTSRIVYLKSYDLFNEFLRYELPQGRFPVITRRDFEALATPYAFGAFTREGNRVAGVFASPRGPVVFVDSQQVTASFGHTSAVISRLDRSRAARPFLAAARISVSTSVYSRSPSNSGSTLARILR